MKRRREEIWKDRQTQKVDFHTGANTAYGRSKNKYSHANLSASLKFMQTLKKAKNTHLRVNRLRASSSLLFSNIKCRSAYLFNIKLF